METLKYTVIKNRKQYDNYCSELKQLLTGKKLSRTQTQESELLTVLIEKWDSDHNTFAELNPVELLQGLMDQRGMNASALATKLDKSKGLISDILNYKKAFSKEMIRDLAAEFKVSQDAFNRLYPLKGIGYVKVATHLSKSAFLMGNKKAIIQPKSGAHKLVAR